MSGTTPRRSGPGGGALTILQVQGACEGTARPRGLVLKKAGCGFDDVYMY